MAGRLGGSAGIVSLQTPQRRPSRQGSPQRCLLDSRDPRNADPYDRGRRNGAFSTPETAATPTLTTRVAATTGLRGRRRGAPACNVCSHQPNRRLARRSRAGVRATRRRGRAPPRSARHATGGKVHCPGRGVRMVQRPRRPSRGLHDPGLRVVPGATLAPGAAEQAVSLGWGWKRRTTLSARGGRQPRRPPARARPPKGPRARGPPGSCGPGHA